METECKHENESNYETIEKHVCKKCGKVYNWDDTPIDWDIITTYNRLGGKYNELEQ